KEHVQELIEAEVVVEAGRERAWRRAEAVLQDGLLAVVGGQEEAVGASADVVVNHGAAQAAQGEARRERDHGRVRVWADVKALAPGVPEEPGRAADEAAVGRDALPHLEEEQRIVGELVVLV